MRNCLTIFGLVLAILASSLLCVSDAVTLPQETVTVFSQETVPPTTAPAEPGITEPPATEPPITEPPVTEPPVTEPPATEPPVTEPPATEPPAPEPEPESTSPVLTLNAPNAFAWDVTNQQLLFAKGDMDAKLYPASITKLFSSYVALQYLDPAAIVTVGDELDLVRTGSSIAYLEKGYQISVEMLVQGMIMPSGNDAAHVLAVAAARAASGNPNMDPKAAVDYFVEMMNACAGALGFTGTHFASPDGYHSDDHYTNLNTIIQIGQLALENPIIRKYAATRTTTVTVASGQKLWWYNTNYLIDPESSYYRETAIGLKTGCTNEARWCLLSAFEVDGRILLIGVFGAVDNHNRMTDVLKLYDLVR